MAALVATSVPFVVGVGRVAAEEPAEADLTGVFAYVANTGDHTVSVIDAARVEEGDHGTTPIEEGVGTAPTGVAVSPDGLRAYVTNSGDGTVSVVRTTTNEVVATMNVGVAGDTLTGIAVSPDGSRVYVVATNSPDAATAATAGDGRLYWIEISDDTMQFSADNAVVLGRTPTAVAVSPDGLRAYVTNSGDGTVSIIDFSEAEPTTETVEVGEKPTAVAVSPKGHRVFITHSLNKVSMLDTATNEQVGAPFAGTAVAGVPTATWSAVVADPEGGSIYVVTRTSTATVLEGRGRLHSIEVTDEAIGSLSAPTDVGRVPTDIAVSPDGARVYVTNSGDGTVSVVDPRASTNTARLVATVEVGATPTGVAIRFDPGAERPPPTDREPPPPLPEFRRLGTMWAPTVGPNADDKRWSENLSPPPLLIDPVHGLAVTRARRHHEVAPACFTEDEEPPLEEQPDGEDSNVRSAWYLYDLRSRAVIDYLCAGFDDQTSGGATGDAGAMDRLAPRLRRTLLQVAAGEGGRVLRGVQRPSGLSTGAPVACSQNTGFVYLAGTAQHPATLRSPSGGKALLLGQDPLFKRRCPRFAGQELPTVHLASAGHVRASGTGELVALELGSTEGHARGVVGTGTFPLYIQYYDMRDRAHEGFLLRSYHLGTAVTDALADGEGHAQTGVEIEARWEIDLRAVCASWLSHWVARTDDAVLAYCWDHRAPGKLSLPGLSQTPLGFLVRIPLDNEGLPIPRPGTGETLRYEPGSDDIRVINASIRRIPTLPGPVTPFADPASGRVFLLTNDEINGTAMWVVDPQAERFVGVATHGLRPAEVPEGKSAVGFNPAIGRGYVLGPDGILVVDGRGDPPLTGAIYPALEEDEVLPEHVEDLATVSVDGRHLVIVPVKGQGYVVFEDRVPLPDPFTDEPVELTVQIEEREGETVANLSGEGEAAGAHVVVSGGPARAVNAVSPTCRGLPEVPPGAPLVLGNESVRQPLNQFIGSLVVERGMFEGRCMADQLLTSGNREVYVAHTDVETGSFSGALGRAQGVSVVQADTATDHDVRSAGHCHTHTLRQLANAGLDYAGSGMGHRDFADDDERPSRQMQPLFDPLFGGYVEFCDSAREHALAPAGLDASHGTAGPDGRGFPNPAAVCDDPGGHPDADSNPSADRPVGTLAAAVACDGLVPAGSAGSAMVAVTFPSAQQPVVVVQEVSSSVESRRVVKKTEIGGRRLDKAHQVTTAEASASGVGIGPITIGKVRTVAETWAGGRTGTARAHLTREWCDVAIGETTVAAGCTEVTGPADPLVVAVSDELQQIFPRLWLSVPDAKKEATPGGFRATVTKDPGLRAADLTVNSDPSFIVPGLEVMLLNDGPEGRNRYILHLAGVHSGSRYGINVLPQFSVPDFGFGDLQQPPAGFGDVGEFGQFATGVEDGEFVAGRPGRPPRFQEVGAASPAVSVPAPDDNVLRRVVQAPLDTLRRFLEWIVQNPREFALLLVVWSILATPVYLLLRRRTFERTLALE